MRYSKEYKLECIRKYKNGENIQDPGGCKHKTFHSYRDVFLYQTPGAD